MIVQGGELTVAPNNLGDDESERAEVDVERQANVRHRHLGEGDLVGLSSVRVSN